MRRPPRRATRRVLAAALVGVAALAAGSCEATSGSAASGAPQTIPVSTAQGLRDAFATAPPGSTIVLASGVYAPRQLKRAGGVSSPPIVLRAADGAQVEVQSLDVNGPGLHVDAVHLTGIIRFRAAAIGSSLTGATVDPGNVIVEGDNVSVTGNILHAPPDRDALDVGATDGTGPSGVVVRGNRIGPGRLSPGSTAHVDCLQVMSATDLVVADNLLYDCPAQTLLLKSDLGPVVGVQVVRNALRGCTPRTTSCPAFMTLQVVPGSHPIHDLRLEGNSIAGAFRGVSGIAGLYLIGNAIDRVEAGCEYLTRDNVVGSARCTVPPGNVLAAPAWQNWTADPPDLHPAAGSPTVDAGPPTMDADASGRTTACGSTWDAGAYERCDP